MKHAFAYCLLFCSSVALATDPKYPVSTIKEELKLNVNVVFRENTSSFTIVARDRASHYVHQAVTIFNARGKNYASEAIYYDRLRKVRDVSASVYDATGKLIKKLKDKEIEDHSAVGDALFSDGRFKYFDLAQGTYPYTVEYEYTVDYKFLFIIPPFTVLGTEKVSCEKAFFALKYPAELKPRFRTSNVQKENIEAKGADGQISNSWSFENVLPIKMEADGPEFHDLIPMITAAPTSFEYDSYVGVMGTWNDYGKWIASLNKDRNILPQTTKDKVIALTKNASTREEKVRILYEYIQNKTRYVSIQLGIGGFQPFEASVVDQNGYGDCKALSNYMIALLDAVSIPSHYALINAGFGADPLIEDFPSTQFNHVLVAVPNEKDTLWLECTSQTNPFGYQGFHTGDRKALLITDNGAKLVKTKHYSAEENLQTRTANVFLEATGDGIAKIRTTYAGLQYEAEGVSDVLNAQGDEQKKWINDNTRIPTFDLIKSNFQGYKTRIPSAVVDLELGLRRYCTVSGKRLFLVPNLMNRSSFIPEKVEQRKTKVVKHFSYTDIDTVHYHVPESLYPEVLPSAVKITSQFGEYESSFKLDQGSVIYTRKLKIFKGEFAPESYEEYIEFHKKINRADNTKIVFLSKT
jgi:transglutaminase-like putative cysteine protease